MAAELKIYSDSACLVELSSTPYSLDLGNFNGTTGEIKTTSILVKNTGDEINTNVVLTETKDTYARVQYSLDDITYHQTTITLGNMAAGDIIRVYIKTTVTADTLTLLDESVNFSVAGVEANASVVATYTILTMLDDVKLALRINSATTTFDTDINNLIDAAKADMGLSGILDHSILDTDSLIKKAIIAYCKAHFGWDNPEADRFNLTYELIRNKLTMAGDYSFYKISFAVGDGTSGLRAVVTLDDIVKDTNASGRVTFYMRGKNNVDYIVEADGYQEDEDTIDINADTTITITLVEV